MTSDLASQSLYKSQPLPTYQQLFHQNSQLRLNLQTLLQYNNKLLSIIQDLNKGTLSPTSPQYQHQHQRCTQQSTFLWKKLSALENYSYQLEMELQQHRSEKQNEEQIEKELKQVLESNEIVQRKFEMKIVQVMGEIEEIKGTQEVASERVVQFMEDRQRKVKEVYEQFEYKDQIIELLTQKVRLFQEEYGRKEDIGWKGDRDSERGREFRGQQGQGQIQIQMVKEMEDKVVQTDGSRREWMMMEQELKEQRRVIEVYENLLRRVRGKIEEKIT